MCVPSCSPLQKQLHSVCTLDCGGAHLAVEGVCERLQGCTVQWVWCVLPRGHGSAYTHALSSPVDRSRGGPFCFLPGGTAHTLTPGQLGPWSTQAAYRGGRKGKHSHAQVCRGECTHTHVPARPSVACCLCIWPMEQRHSCVARWQPQLRLLGTYMPQAGAGLWFLSDALCIACGSGDVLTLKAWALSLMPFKFSIGSEGQTLQF